MNPVAQEGFVFFEEHTLTNPYDFYDGVRQAGPIIRIENPHRETYLVLEYDVIREITKHPELFSSRPAGRNLNFYPKAVAYLKEHGYGFSPQIITADPPVHTLYRNVFAQALREKRAHQLRPRIIEIAGELIDSFVDGGKCEFVMDYAWRLAILVIAEMLGVDKNDSTQFRRWANAWVLQLEQPLSEDEMLECMKNIAELQHYLVAALKDRVANPRDDILTDFAAATVDKGDGVEPLSLREVLGMCEALIIAGNDTAVSALSLGMLRLVEQPEIAERIRGDRKLIANFAEESLRYESAVQNNFRSVAEDLQFHGHKMSKGAQILLCWGAANRDPAAFEEAEKFDIDRPSVRKHQSFGYGIHACAGAVIARQELTESYALLLDRLHNIHLADGLALQDIKRKGGVVTHGLERLPIQFDAVLK